MKWYDWLYDQLKLLNINCKKKKLSKSFQCSNRQDPRLQSGDHNCCLKKIENNKAISNQWWRLWSGSNCNGSNCNGSHCNGSHCNGSHHNGSHHNDSHGNDDGDCNVKNKTVKNGNQMALMNMSMAMAVAAAIITPSNSNNITNDMKAWEWQWREHWWSQGHGTVITAVSAQWAVTVMFLQRNRADGNSIAMCCGISISISCCLSEMVTVQKWHHKGGKIWPKRLSTGCL